MPASRPRPALRRSPRLRLLRPAAGLRPGRRVHGLRVGAGAWARPASRPVRPQGRGSRRPRPFPRRRRARSLRAPPLRWRPGAERACSSRAGSRRPAVAAVKAARAAAAAARASHLRAWPRAHPPPHRRRLPAPPSRPHRSRSRPGACGGGDLRGARGGASAAADRPPRALRWSLLAPPKARGLQPRPAARTFPVRLRPPRSRHVVRARRRPGLRRRSSRVLRSRCCSFLAALEAAHVDVEEDPGRQERCDQRRAAVRHERQRDPGDGRDAHRHSHVHESLEGEHRHDAGRQ